MLGILGNKVGMTQLFAEDGTANPVTVIKVGPCTITQIKSIATHGYDAIQIGYQQTPEKKLTKPELGHLKKANVTPLKYLALLFAIVFGYFIWDEIPTFKTLTGAFLVIVSTLIIFRREIYKKKIITSKTIND